MTGAAHSPSDVTSAHAARLLVAGRLRQGAHGQPSGFALTDAFTSLPVTFREQPSVRDGQLVVLDVVVRDHSLCDAIVVEAHANAFPESEAGDAVRFGELGVGLALRARARAIRAIRAHFERERFLEVETPALAVCPGLDTHLEAFAVDASDRFLITSPEYHMKRLLVGGVPRCFQLARCFRDGERGARHNPEFTMLEWYRAFAGADAIMADTEAIVCAVASEIGDATGGHLSRLDLTRPFQRVTVAEAFARYAGVDEPAMLRLAGADEEAFFRVLVERVEPALEALAAPVFLHDYPASMASLARLLPHDNRYADRFELYAAGVELSNGFGELTDATEQLARFERDQRSRQASGKPVYPIDTRFIAALREGMPPASGNALGVDRLLMLACGSKQLGDVIAFPFDQS